MAMTDPFEPARRRKRRIGWYLVAVGAFLALRELVEGSPITNLATNPCHARGHRRRGRAHRLGLVLDRQQPESAVLACGCFFRDAPRIGPAWGNALPMLAATLGLQCANTSDRNTVAPCHATSAPRLRSRKVSPTDSISAKSRRTRLEAFNAWAIWSWTCCAWTAVRIRGP